ncbi:MAG: precorrin-8X methylmutase [Eubacteriales bacterium]|nr:precorrin-8X methylmutase [Eubacteriales bacterium]
MTEQKKPRHTLPGDIERTSMAIITGELEQRGIALLPGTEAVVRRVIHTTADFDYAESLRFTPGAVAAAVAALKAGADIITDTNMARSGVSKPSLSRLGREVCCYMAEPQVAQAAREQGTTRAVAAVRYAAQRHSSALFAVGNAPTALLALCDLMEETAFRPAAVIGVPVGFVNVVESKERLMAVCARLGVPAIAAMGRKGGSNVAAAICNALIYTAVDALDPVNRGWQG